MRVKHTPTLIAFVLAISVPFSAWASDGTLPLTTTAIHMSEGRPFEQDLIVTAYYSPTPNQCSYVMGDFTADTVLNGQGIHGADGTRVYAGMAAAPPTYPFGTRLTLPGIGTVTVHDRGSAIQEAATTHRLDLWVGTGEEGLARALAFGVRHIHAVVYPKNSAQPSESIDLTSLQAPPAVLRPYLTDNATISDCEAMLTFGNTLETEMLWHSALHHRFAFRNNISFAEELTFFVGDPNA